jgi:hypothetical protein
MVASLGNPPLAACLGQRERRSGVWMAPFGSARWRTAYGIDRERVRFESRSAVKISMQAGGH